MFMPRVAILFGLAVMLGGAIAGSQASAGGVNVSKERSTVQKVKACDTPRGWCEVSGTNETGTVCYCRIYPGHNEDFAKGTIVMRGVFDNSGTRLPLPHKAKKRN
jgi:hypothetical protein